MTETSTTKEIKFNLLKRTQKRIGKYGAFEVTFSSRYLEHDKGSKKDRCDYVEWDGLNFTCFEIKSTKDDFLSNAHLSLFGQRNYIVAPIELAQWIKKEGFKHRNISSFGILAYKNQSFKLIKKCSVQAVSIGDASLILEGFAKAASRDMMKNIDKSK